MARRVRRISKANADIVAALDYLRARNPQAALRFLRELRELCRLIGEYPEMFPIQKRSEHLALGQVRRAVLRRFGYLIYYTHDAEFVNILRIVHGARENL